MICNKLYKTFIVLSLLFYPLVSFSENIDPDDTDSQYFFGENVGWLNAEPSGDGGPGVQVEDTKLTGYIWAENIGWISLSCENTQSCGTANYGVANRRIGYLSGYAWSENTGWISFSCENTNSCDSVDYSVSIDPLTGEFSGNAWGENIGWVTFRDDAPVAYGITTSWSASVSSCQSDFPPADGDVDGEDLSDYTSDSAGISLYDFSMQFGRIDCF